MRRFFRIIYKKVLQSAQIRRNILMSQAISQRGNQIKVPKGRKENMDYTITDQDREMIKTDVPLAKVKSEVEKAKRKYPTDQIFVTFFRATDGQKGYLNKNGQHSLTGKAW